MQALVLCINPVLAVNVVQCLGVAGIRSHVMGVGRFPQCRFSRYCARYLRCTADELTFPTDALAKRINDYCSTHDIAMIVPVDLPCTMTVAHLAPRLTTPTFPLSTPDVLRRVHDKWKLAQFAEANNIPIPRTQLLERAADARQLTLQMPVMVKPPNGEGGREVVRIDSFDALEKYARQAETDGRVPLLVQEYLPGYDIDLSLLADHGRLVAWTIQRDNARPCSRTFLNDDRVLKIARQFVEASGFHGVAHLDMRSDSRDNGVRLIECNPRFWATLLYSYWGGVNFAELGMMLARGEDPARHFEPMTGIQTLSGFKVAKRMVRWFTLGLAKPRIDEDRRVAWAHLWLDPMPELVNRLFYHAKWSQAEPGAAKPALNHTIQSPAAVASAPHATPRRAPVEMAARSNDLP